MIALFGKFRFALFLEHNWKNLFIQQRFVVKFFRAKKHIKCGQNCKRVISKKYFDLGKILRPEFFQKFNLLCDKNAIPSRSKKKVF